MLGEGDFSESRRRAAAYAECRHLARMMTKPRCPVPTDPGEIGSLHIVLLRARRFGVHTAAAGGQWQYHAGHDLRHCRARDLSPFCCASPSAHAQWRATETEEAAAAPGTWLHASWPSESGQIVRDEAVEPAPA